MKKLLIALTICGIFTACTPKTQETNVDSNEISMSDSCFDSCTYDLEDTL